MSTNSTAALVLEADAREGARLEAALARLGFAAKIFRRQAAFTEEVLRASVGSGAAALLVDYESLGAPRLATVQQLVRLATRGPLLVTLSGGSHGLATRLGLLGVADTMVKPACPATLEGALFPDRASPPTLRPLSLKELEEEHIQRTLLLYDNNMTHAARALGICRTSLQRKRAKRSQAPRPASPPQKEAPR